MGHYWREGARIDLEEKFLLKLSRHLTLIGAHSSRPEEKRRMFQRQGPGLHLVAGGFSRIISCRIAWLDSLGSNVVITKITPRTVPGKVTGLSATEATSSGYKTISFILAEVLEFLATVSVLIWLLWGWTVGRPGVEAGLRLVI